MPNLTDLEEYKLSFLKESLQDVQETIRATDIKAGFFLVILCLPLNSIDKIFQILIKLFTLNPFVIFIVILLISTWLISLILLTYCLVPFINPKDSVDFNNIAKHPEGFYFGGYHEFNLGFWRSLIPYTLPRTKISLDNDIKILRDMDLESFKNELHFERLKLIFIRNLKLRRLQQCTIFMFLDFIIIAILFILFLAKI